MSFLNVNEELQLILSRLSEWAQGVRRALVQRWHSNAPAGPVISAVATGALEAL
jgi:hypothetical protein